LGNKVGNKVGNKMQQLSARAIVAIKTPGRYRVDENLSVLAQEKAGKIYTSFVLRYQIDGKRVQRSLGSTSKISLRDAREKADQLIS
jgi:hypothetical protein